MHNLDYKYLKFKHLIYDIVIDFWKLISMNDISMNDISRKYNSMVNLTKFLSNKNILSRIITIDYKLVCCQTLSMFHMYVILHS